MSSIHDVPGQDVVDKLVKDVREPVTVFHLVPSDTGGIRDPGMQAIVALATSLQWNVVRKPGRPVFLIARDGFKHAIPTDTSIRFNVFLNRLNATITHSLTAYPSPELAEAIVRQFKLDPSHARAVRAACGHGVMDGVVDPDEPDELLPEEEPTIEEQALEVIEAAAAKADDPTILRIEPTYAITTKGWGYESPIMVTVVRQLVDDGAEQITYRCKNCGLEFPTKKGVGSHWQQHVKDGTEKATNDLRKELIKIPLPQPEYGEPPEPDPIVEVEVEWTPDEPLPEEEPEGRAPVIGLGHISLLLQMMIDEAVETATRDLRADISALQAEIDRLRQERAALRDLLS